LAYDSYYKRDKMENLDENGKKEKEPVTISLQGPLTFWIGILVIATMLQTLAIPLANMQNRTALNKYFDEFANYVLYIPGILILPLITALWVGERVSYLDRKKSTIAYKGVLNALYISMIYAAAIVIIYIIMIIQKTGTLSTLSTLTFAEYLILIPLGINIVVIPLFAVLSGARRYD
jgi:hypothetical protein